MKHKALLKLILLYLAAAVVMFVLLNVFAMHRMSRHVLMEKAELLTEEAGLIAEEYIKPYYQDATKFGDMLMQLRSVENFLDIRIWVVDTNGIVFVDTSGLSKGVNVDNLNAEFLNRVIEEKYLQDVSLPGAFSEEVLAVAQPIYGYYRLRGYVCIFTPMRKIEESCNNYLNFLNICYLIFLLILLVIFVCIYIITLAPVRKMTKVTEEYAKGKFGVPMKIRSHDEYRSLANAIQYMANEFKNLEESQKKFLANISHDFRSPLTSIKGYAEALADGTIPSEDQKKYLDIILFETERLAKLTENILTLTSLEKNGMMLEMKPFDINEVIRRTALTFEGICTKRRITLNLVFGDEELFAEADMGRIQQVLYNLIDNAVKFSDPDSSIDIRAEEKGSKILVEVKDHGIGIPRESLNKIWERFYKTDLSRGKDKKGTGLGLTIAKEIIRAHKENIDVISTEGVGTEFIFSLPKAVY